MRWASRRMQLVAAFVIIALTLWLLVRQVEVRLVLMGAGLALATVALKPLVVFEVFVAEIGNGKTIGPICSAMGYALVLRATGCDRAMVRALLKPLRRAGWLLLPGGCGGVSDEHRDQQSDGGGCGGGADFGAAVIGGGLSTGSGGGDTVARFVVRESMQSG